jgi:NAD(P)-dependent dehydrogenase (short-subunit alcohol dehydrogenase family)
VPVLDRAAVKALAPASLFQLDGRVAVVTGAAGGLGRWFAAGLGAAGAAVLVTDLEQGPLDELVAVLGDAGIVAAGLAVDLVDDDAPERVVDAAVDQLGGVHVLVNNAAVNRRLPMLEMDGESWDWIMRIDLRLPYFLSCAAARRMIEQGGGGSIVSISSLNALYALEQISVYGPAKAGLSQLTKVMALEWADTASVRTRSRPASWTRHWPRRSGPTTTCAAGSSTGSPSSVRAFPESSSEPVFCSHPTPGRS